MATVSFALNNADTTTTISSATDLILLSDPNNLYTGVFSALRVGNDLHLDFGGKGEIIITNQFLSATPVVTALRMDGDPVTFTFNNTVTGGAGNDFIVGTVNGELINAGNGVNMIFGGDGNDTINGGTDYDEIHGGAGNDSLVGNGSDDDFTPGAGNDTIDATGDTQSWQSASYSDSAVPIIVNFSGATINGQATNTVKELAGTPTIDVLKGIDAVDGSSGNDTFYAGRLVSWQPGGDAEIMNTSFNGQGGDDHFVAGGNNTQIQVEYYDAKEAVIVNLSDSAVTALGQTVASMTARDGLGGIDTFDLTLGGQANISGSDFADHLVGATNNGTTLVGQGGDDTLIGGNGTDTAAYWDTSDTPKGFGIMANLTGGSVTLGSVTVQSNQVRDHYGNTDTLQSIENISGSKYDDIILGSIGDNNLRGEDGNDYLFGNSGNDWLEAGEGVDTVDGGDGTGDTLHVQGNYADFTIVGISSTTFRLISNANGMTQDVLASNVENFMFWDGFKTPVQLLASALATSGNDLLNGTVANDTIDGLAGNDIITGMEGDDSLSGGAGNDTLVGGPGADTLVGGAGDDVYIIDQFSAAGETIVEDAAGGTDRVETGLSIYSLESAANVENLSFIGFAASTFSGTGNALDNVLTGNVSNDNLFGGAGNDTLLGGAGADVLRGDAGDDRLDGGAITDPINGTDFNYANYQTSTGAVTVNLGAGAGVGAGTASDGLGGTDTLFNINGVIGSANNDSITGSTALVLEQFDGGAGNDTMDGGIITDTLNQENNNRVNFANVSGAGVTVDLAAGTAVGNVGSNSGNDTLININQVRGSNFNDTISGSDSTLTEQFEGRAGNDFIDGRGGIDLIRFDGATAAVTVNLANNTATGDASVGSDTLANIEGVRGSKFNDSLTGGNAANGTDATNTSLLEIFLGGAGNDTINGGQGYDRADYSTSTVGANVNLTTGTARDGLGGIDTLISIEGVRGSSFDDTLTGSNADFETFEGREGNDHIDGLGGIDVADYKHSKAGVAVNLTTGIASDGYGSTDTLANIEAVRGSTFNDSITGGSGNDKLMGESGNDSLSGGAGADTLDAGSGVDTVDGGADSDTLVLLGNFATYTITQPAAGDTRLVGAGQDITLRNVESVQFADVTKTIAQLSGNAPTTAGDDTWTGTAGNDTVDGLAGNDSLSGLAGNDKLTGGAGNDTLLGGDGADTLLGGTGADYLKGGAGNDSIDGGVIADRINYTDTNVASYADATGAVTISLAGITGTGTTGTGTASGAGVGSDTLANIFGIQGSSYNDTITGSSALTFEQIEGGQGNDSLNGGTITDTLNGDNVNRVSYQNASGAVNVNLDTNLASGADGNDTLANFTHIRGSNFGDTLTGSDRTDLTEHFEGRAGNDTIDGAGGLDVARYDFSTAGVVVDLANGTASDGYGTTDTLLNIEGVRGSQFADSLTGGNVANDALEFFMGRDGDDTIDGGSGYDRAEYTLSTSGVNVTLGGAGNGTASDGYGTTDTLISIEGVRGSAFDDTLTGSDDAGVYETFEGREGNDSIDGMGGIDRVDYKYSKAAVTVDLLAGTASDGYGGTDTLDNIENVQGSRDFNDNIVGSVGDNALAGLGGNDTINGGDGNDSIDGGDGNDSLLGGAGNDMLAGGEGNDTINGGDGADILMGGNGNDSLVGGNGNNILAGDAGNNTLVGGTGVDVADFDFQDGTGAGGVVASLNAGAGTDSLMGE